MYRGFITEIGTVLSTGEHIEIRAPKACEQLEAGGSFAVNGACLSAESLDDGVVRACISEETRRRTTLDTLAPGVGVNVEFPIRIGDALESHLVQGHIDAVGKVVRIDNEAPGRRVWIRPPERFVESVVAKGSVTVDGVSLTVAEVSRDRFSVALVPSTLEQSTLVDLEVGMRVNLESDLTAKLARRHEGKLEHSLRRVISNLPWAGLVHGRLGVEKVVQQIADGGCVLVWDPDREGEGDVIAAGKDMRPETWTFLLTQVYGHTTVPCDVDRLARLEIPPMPGDGDHFGTAMHVSVDLASNPGTGVSPIERAATVRGLAAAEAKPEDFVRPGHVFPLGARRGGMRERSGHTEATVELCRAAGLPTVGVCCEVMHPDGQMAGAAELERFALYWGLPLIDIGDLASWL